jgi:hypothetical protein
MAFSQLLRSNGAITVNDEMGRIWKKVIVACFKVLSQNFLEGTKENP